MGCHCLLQTTPDEWFSKWGLVTVASASPGNLIETLHETLALWRAEGKWQASDSLFNRAEASAVVIRREA